MDNEVLGRSTCYMRRSFYTLVDRNRHVVSGSFRQSVGTLARSLPFCFEADSRLKAPPWLVMKEIGLIEDVTSSLQERMSRFL